jgi:ADP-ribose pyrophosphatase YjhB (NUDIX family)
VTPQEPFSPDPPSVRKRNSSKALITREGCVLLTRNLDGEGDFFLLPGGGQEFGETLHDAMVREVLEETGYSVVPGELVLVREYIGAHHEFASEERDVHQVEFVFLAGLESEEPVSQASPDAWQTGVEWVPLEEIPGCRIYPSVLSELIPKLAGGFYDGPLYLGDVN